MANDLNSCTDSIIVNGKGRVYCPDHQALINLNLPALKTLFNGSVITDKGSVLSLPLPAQLVLI